MPMKENGPPTRAPKKHCNIILPAAKLKLSGVHYFQNFSVATQVFLSPPPVSLPQLLRLSGEDGSSPLSASLSFYA